MNYNDYTNWMHHGSDVINISANSIVINDYDAELIALPETKFNDIQSVDYLLINAKNISSFPDSFRQLVINNAINITNNKLTRLPQFVLNSTEIQFLHINAYRMALEDDLDQLTKLETLELVSFKGKQLPTAIGTLKQLKSIHFHQKINKKINHLDLVQLLGQSTSLKKVQFDFPLQLDEIGDQITVLDHIDDLFFRKKCPIDTAFLSLSLLRNASIYYSNFSNDRIKKFQLIVNPHPYTTIQRKILFAVYLERLDLIHNLIENPLESLTATTCMTIHLSNRLPKNLNDNIKTYLPNVTCKVNKNLSKYVVSEQDVVLINTKTPLEFVMLCLSQNKTLASEDHLKEALTLIESPWLKQKENQASIAHIQQLILSNQEENVMLALQIISGGGATPEIIAMLAALMMAHPHKKIAKEAEKLFKQLGPSSSYNLIKKSKISLRRSGNSVRKINQLFELDINIDALTFRILHALIAGDNVNIADIHSGQLLVTGSFDAKIPSWIKNCHQFKRISLHKSTGIDINASFLSLSNLEQLNHLDLSKCTYKIGNKIAALTQLKELNLASNQLLNSSDLRTLKQLRWLNLEGCQITNWDFVNDLPQLQYLNVSRNKLKVIPDSILKHKGIKTLILKQNKLTNIPDLLTEGTYELLDLSNNLIEDINYKLFNLQNVKQLLLRSNKITTFDVSKISKQKKRSLTSLNLASNSISTFELSLDIFPKLFELDLSKNNLTTLHDSIFTTTKISKLYATHNFITRIPIVATDKSFTHLDLQANSIAALPEYIGQLSAQNLDLRNNKIASIHPSIIQKEDDYSRLYWKLEGNPISYIPYT